MVAGRHVAVTIASSANCSHSIHHFIDLDHSIGGRYSSWWLFAKDSLVASGSDPCRIKKESPANALGFLLSSRATEIQRYEFSELKIK